jgi:hypothetical protein
VMHLRGICVGLGLGVLGQQGPDATSHTTTWSAPAMAHHDVWCAWRPWQVGAGGEGSCWLSAPWVRLMTCNVGVARLALLAWWSSLWRQLLPWWVLMAAVSTARCDSAVPRCFHEEMCWPWTEACTTVGACGLGRSPDTGQCDACVGTHTGLNCACGSPALVVLMPSVGVSVVTCDLEPGTNGTSV